MSFTTYVTVVSKNDNTTGFRADPLDPQGTADRIAAYMYKGAAGCDQWYMDVQGATTTTLAPSTGTLTTASGATGDTAVVQGTTFTNVDHRETSNITYTADTAGSLNSKFFTFQDQPGNNKYYVWFNINSAGVDPAVAGATGIEVAGVTGATAAALATATVTATAATTTSTVTLAADVSGSLNSKFFTIDEYGTGAGYYVWFNIGGLGVDPAPAGLKGIPVAAATNASAVTLTSAAYAALLGVPSGITVTSPTTTSLGFAGSNGSGAVLQDSISAPTRFLLSQPVHGVAVTAGASGHVIFTDIAPGVATKVTDGSAATSFTFTRTITGSALTSTQYQLGTSDTATSADLAAAINANTTANKYVIATSALGVVTLTSLTPGFVANLITLSASGNVTASGATLTGGANATPNIMHYGL